MEEASLQPSNELINSWLLAIAQQRDRGAFERLYNHFAGRIKSYMMRHGADKATADDLAQEAMVQVWRKAMQYDPERATPAAWMFRIARNLQIDRLRRRKFFEVELTDEAERTDEGLSGHERATDQIDANRLRELIKELPDEQLVVIQLAFFEGLTHSEIGEQLDLPLGTVKSRLRLAFGKLRTAMGEEP